MKELLGGETEKGRNDIEQVIAEAEVNTAKAIEALDALSIHVPERHSVLVPGTPTTPERSESLLRDAIIREGEVSLYLGITVCPYICKFCRYYNRTGPIKDLEKMTANEVSDVIDEMEIANRKFDLPKKAVVNSAYIGGGTPTLMSSKSDEKLFEAIRGNYEIKANTEISVECTPETLTGEKLSGLKKLGVNRISMGVQRLDDEWLKSVNRRHSVQDVFDAMELLGKNNVNFNIDLMYGFEGQTVESFCGDLKKVLEYTPTEITLYRLESQKKTDDRDIKIKKSERNIAYLMQEAGRILLTKAGYSEGPSGWFTKRSAERAKVYEDRWNRQIPLIGFGPEAYSYSKDQQYTNRSIGQYREAIDRKEMPIDGERTFEYREPQKEIRGMVFKLKSQFKTSYDHAHDRFFESLAAQGLGEIGKENGNNFFKLNKYGVIAIEEIVYVLIEESKNMFGESADAPRS